MSASFRSALMVVAGCSAAFLIMPAATARADVFNMPAGQTNLQFVTVGDAGNGADTRPATVRFPTSTRWARMT